MQKRVRRVLNALSITVALVGLPLAAQAGGTHEGGHHDELEIGSPGEAGKVTRTIDVVMRETPEGRMVFEPAAITLASGETVRLNVRNEGVLKHEMVIDTHEAVMEHKVQMEKFPEMIHDDPNSISLEPSTAGEIIWTFSNPGTFTFGCLIPGHFDAGMHGSLVVNQS